MSGVETTLTFSAGALGALFVFSGGQKLAAPFSAALAMVRFGLARRVNQQYGRIAGCVEVAVGVALIAAPTEWWSFSAAAILGALFVVVVARALHRGAAFRCGCFGEDSSRISASTLIRASVVLLVAVVGVALALLFPASVEFAAQVLGVASGVLVMCILTALLTARSTRPFTVRVDSLEMS